MDIIKEWLLSEGYEKFQNAKDLGDSKCDNEKEPYKLKYEARDVFKTLKCKLEDFIEDLGGNIELQENTDDNEEITSLNILLAIVNFELAINFIECEEISTGEDYLKKCLEIMADKKDHTSYATLVIATFNQFSILWSNRASFPQSLEYLKQSEEIYASIINNGCTCPINYNEYWRSNTKRLTHSERKIFFDNLHTLTLYYLAQIYNSMGEAAKSAKYCHVTLARQMNSKQYDPKDWSLNCATLSQYYVTQDNYKFARYCLSCAEIINKEIFVDLESKEYPEDEDKGRVEEKLYKSKADVYRCWAKYALNLIRSSHEKNLEQGLDSNDENQDGIDEIEFKKLTFGDLEVSHLENQVSYNYIKDHASAKSVFTFGLKCLQKAKDFYKFDGYVTDYVEIDQDISQLYKYLAFYDDDFDNRCKMHKRRIDMLNKMLIELNPQHYLQICRQLTFEIADSYSEMVALKKKIIEENPEKFSAHSVKKINFLTLQGIKYYNGFIDSYKHEDKFPLKFEDDDVRGVLLSYFCMARLNSKYFTNDKQTKLDYLKKEKECYSFIVSYCEEHKDMPKVFEEELSVSREMLELFERKIARVMAEI